MSEKEKVVTVQASLDPETIRRVSEKDIKSLMETISRNITVSPEGKEALKDFKAKGIEGVSFELGHHTPEKPGMEKMGTWIHAPWIGSITIKF